MAIAVAVSELAEAGREAHIQVAAVSVPAGWPSPAQDYQTDPIDLTEHLVRDRAATIIMRVSGDSMEGAGIFDGDRILVDRSLEPKHGDVVVAVIGAEFTVKRLHIHSNGLVDLEPANSRYHRVRIRELEELRVVGVVTWCLHHLHHA